MPIQFRCAGCSQPIEVDSQFAGKTAQCPYCQRVITVPVESNLDTNVPAIARPTTVSSSPPPIPAAPPLPDFGGGGAGTDTPWAWERGRLDPRVLNAKRTGNYALIFCGLSVALFVFAMGSVFFAWASEISKLGTPNPTQEQVQQALQSVANQPRPYSNALGFGAMFFGVSGFVLGIVSWRQAPTSNWRAWISMGFGGLFLFCLCGIVGMAILSAAAGLAPPA